MIDLVGTSVPVLFLLGLPFALLFILLIGLLLMAGAARGRKPVPAPVPVALAPDVETRVRDLIARRRKIEAIKVVRENTGLGLKDAKDLVDAIEAGYPIDPLQGPFGPHPGGAVAPATRAGAERLLAEGELIKAIKLVRSETGLGLREAKDYCEALRDGRLPPAAPLAERARALIAAGDRAGAVAMVCGETGMSQSEAEAFLDALG